MAEKQLLVRLLCHTPAPEQAVALGGRLCYSDVGIEQLYTDMAPKSEKFVGKLTSMGHLSPIEHASFTFGIEGVSRSLLAQITRHRLASYSVQSQRYVKEACFEFVVPPEIEAIPEAKAEFLRAMEEDQAHYESLTAILKEKHVRRLLEEGKDEKTANRLAEKQAIEDARFVLPNACATKMIATFNARSLMNFFAHRCCNRAQWEIRQVAEQMLALVKEQAPHLFALAGPPCLTGPCPEGKMSCGKMLEVRRKYGVLEGKS